MDAEILLSQARETRATDRCDAFLLNYQCFVMVCADLCVLLIALSAGGLPPSGVGQMSTYDAWSVLMLTSTPRGAS